MNSSCYHSSWSLSLDKLAELKNEPYLTDEQALEVEASVEALFLVEGELMSIKAKRWMEQPEAVKANLRPERDRLLAASDWTQLNDTTLPEEVIAAWATYRQDLRDLTDEIDENGEVDFPEKP